MLHSKHTGQLGFTLLEVMVALAIVAIALAAAVKASAMSVDNLSYLRNKTLAHWVALNLLAERRLQPVWPAVGGSNGEMTMAGRDWPWLIEITSTKDADVRRIQLTVGGEASLASLTGFLPRPLKAGPGE